MRISGLQNRETDVPAYLDGSWVSREPHGLAKREEVSRVTQSAVRTNQSRLFVVPKASRTCLTLLPRCSWAMVGKEGREP